jgi:hypothetical protein
MISGESVIDGPARYVGGKWPGLAPTGPGCAYNDALRRESASRDMSAQITTAGLQMTNLRSFEEMLNYRIALLKIDSAFEACSQFGNANKQAFYAEVKNRLSQHNANDDAEARAATDKPPSLFRDRCFELAEMAPTDEIRRFLLSVVEFCDANPDIEDTGAELHKRLA